MKIAYNPLGSGAHTPAPDNKDIIFDLVTRTIYAKGVPFDGTKYSTFKKHTSPDNTGGSEGLVPIPSYSTTNTRLLREDGLWINVAGVSAPDDHLSTESTNSVENRVIAEEFEKVFALLVLKAENVYKIINVGGINLVASGTNDVLEFVQGDGILLLPSEINKSITISTRAIGLLGIDISYNSGQLITKVADTYFNRWNEVFNWYTSVTEEDTDDYINKWQEIVDFLNGVPDTTLNGILANFVKDLETTGEGNAVTDVSKSGNKITVTKGNSFLPLSGGTISNANDTLIIKRLSDIGASYIKYHNNEGFLGTIGIGGSGSTFPYEPLFQNKNNTIYKLWHSGNDGTGSGLDADLLDGQHASYFATAASLGNYVTLDTDLVITGVKTFLNGGNREKIKLSGGSIISSLNTNGGWDRVLYFGNTSGDTSVSACFGVYGLGISNGPNRINHVYIAHQDLNYRSATFKVYANRATILDNEIYHKGNLKNLSDLNDDIVSGKYLPLSGGTMTLGEGLKFHADGNYFGTNSDARIISLLDDNGTICDGGLIIDERCTNNGTTTITELLRIRDSEFKWKGLNILHSGNSSVTKSGQTLTVTINGTSQSLTNSTYNFSGTSFTSGNQNIAEHDANNITSNGVWYYTANGPATSLGASTNDGALYSQAYNTSWVGQIAQNYRNGDLFTRGRNNGTWTAWKKVAYVNDIPTVTNYYWANVPVSSTSSTTTKPTFGLVTTPRIDVGNYIFMNYSGEGIYLNGNGLHWHTNRNYQKGLLYFTSTGNVGVGTGSPAYKLHVNGNVFSTGFIKSGSDDSYVLLGGGGHKTIASFQTTYDSRYVKKAGDIMTGRLTMNTTITDHTNPTDQCLVINSAAPGGTTLTLKNSPGIGFHISSYSWGSLVFNGAFNFINNTSTGYMDVNLRTLSASGFINANSQRFNYGLAYYNADIRTVTGTIVITLPNGWNSSMNTYEIDIYEYNGYTEAADNILHSKLIIDGYNYGSDARWYNYGYTQIGSYNKGVRLGYNGSKCVIMLGTTSTTWIYPQVHLSRVITGYNNQTAWSTDYSISVITNESSYSAIVTAYRLRQRFDDIVANTFRGTLSGNASSATRVLINQHTANNTEYPIVWSNSNNTTNAVNADLFKSYNHLLYNPSAHRITTGQYVANNSVGPHFRANSAVGSWAYIQLNNGSNYWDIATRSDSGNGGLWLARLSGANDGIFVSTGNNVGISTSTPADKFHVNGGYVRIVANGKYLRIGPQNATHAHYETDANTSHWFNKRVEVNGHVNPYTNNSFTSGTSDKRWSNVYSVLGNFTGAISSSLTTSTHLRGNQGIAIINSTAAAGYNMLAKMNSTNGVFNIGTYNASFNLYYTTKTVIDAGTNSNTYGATLLNESGNSSFPGLVSVNTLRITNTSAVAHLTFSRGGYNYIAAPSGGSIAFCVNGKAAGTGANCDLVVSGGTVHSGANNITTLGTSDFRWSNIYSVLGNFAGTVSINCAYPNIICNNNASGATESNIRFGVGGTTKGYVGYNTTHGTWVYNSASLKYLAISDSGTPHVSGHPLLYNLRMAVTSAFDANKMTTNAVLYTSTGDVGSNTSTWNNFPTGKPAGGFGLLNIAEGQYRRQIFGTYYNPHLYTRYLYYSNGAVWSGWSTIALTSDIPNPANYYWANVKVSATSSTSTSPTFQECYANGWFRSTGNNGWYNPTHNSHIHPNATTTYGNLVVRGAKSDYTGINLGNSTSHMTVMSTAAHHGLYCEADGVWEFYYNKGNKRAGILTSSLQSTSALTVGGGLHVGGTIRVVPTLGSYQEGIRIQPYGSYSILMLLGTDTTAATSGTSAKSWGFFNNDGTLYINKATSSGAGGPRAMATSTGWTFGNTSTNSYALNAASFICDSWVRTKGATGWYNESYGGGWYMGDSTWIRNYNGKQIFLSVSTYPSLVCNALGGSESNIRFEIAGANKGYTGYKTGYGTFLWNSTASKYVYIADNGYFYTQSYINVGAGNEKNASNPPYVWGVNGSDNFMRTYATSSLSVGKAANADYATSAPAAANYGGTGSTTKIKIKINSTTSWMLSFVVTIYQGYKSSKIMVSGYNYGANYWHEPEAVLLGDSNSATSIPVYFGYDSAWNLWVGFDGGNYTGVSISDVTNGYSQISSLKGLFTISNVSSLTTIQKTVTAVNSVNYAVSAGTSSNVVVNSSDSNSTYRMVWHSGNTLYSTAGIYCNPSSDYLYATSMLATSWFRSTGNTGWYSLTHGGGIYMEDSTYVRTYGSKAFYVSNTGDHAIYTAGGFASARTSGSVFATYYNGTWYKDTLYTHGNGNLSISPPGGSLYLGYNRGSVYFCGSTAYVNRSSYFYAVHYYETSDIRKKNILNYIEDLRLEDIPIISFTWKNDSSNKHIGSIAQEVEKILPEVVETGEDGYKSIDYGVLGTVSGVMAIKLLAKLLEKIKELEKEIEILKNKN